SHTSRGSSTCPSASTVVSAMRSPPVAAPRAEASCTRHGDPKVATTVSRRRIAPTVDLPARTWERVELSLRESPMKTPILKHVALTVPRTLVSDTPQRRHMLEFYESVFGWRNIDLMAVEGERVVLHLHQLTHFLYLVGGEAPT